MCEKFFYLFFPMLTRKRHREQVYLQKLNAYTYEFDPIRESVAKFLTYHDVAFVSNLNKEYNTKIWIVVLSHSCRVNDFIKVDPTSWLWIVKYAQHLKYQKLRISSNHRKFFQFEIHILDTLLIEHCDKPIRLPKNLRELRINDCWRPFPKMNGITCFVFTRPWSTRDFDIENLPSSLISLYLQCLEFNSSEIPLLPNLTTLTLYKCSDFLQMDQLHVKCPNIHTLCILDSLSEDLNGIQGLQIDRLIIDCSEFMNVNFLKLVKVNHLVFSNKCTYIMPRMCSVLHHIKDIRINRTLGSTSPA
jgi:hypothetical protein